MLDSHQLSVLVTWLEGQNGEKRITNSLATHHTPRLGFDDHRHTSLSQQLLLVLQVRRTTERLGHLVGPSGMQSVRKQFLQIRRHQRQRHFRGQNLQSLDGIDPGEVVIQYLHGSHFIVTLHRLPPALLMLLVELSCLLEFQVIFGWLGIRGRR